MLTTEQQSVFVAMAKGESVKDISFRMGRSEKTVQDHRAKVYRKTECHNPVDICRMAIRLGLIEP
jgi:DNA-binding NarL/FixJ family response regulator